MEPTLGYQPRTCCFAFHRHARSADRTRMSANETPLASVAEPWYWRASPPRPEGDPAAQARDEEREPDRPRPGEDARQCPSPIGRLVADELADAHALGQVVDGDGDGHPRLARRERPLPGR